MWPWRLTNRGGSGACHEFEAPLNVAAGTSGRVRVSTSTVDGGWIVWGDVSYRRGLSTVGVVAAATFLGWMEVLEVLAVV